MAVRSLWLTVPNLADAPPLEWYQVPWPSALLARKIDALSCTMGRKIRLINRASVANALSPKLSDCFEMRITHITDFKKPAISPFFYVRLELIEN